jgi:histone deacetylase 1/2
MSGKTKVTYYYDNDIGSFSYAPSHPMKPHRVRMTHNLVLAYNLYEEMEILVCYFFLLILFPFKRPKLITADDMKQFHSSEYIDFLRTVTPESKNKYDAHFTRCFFI